MYMLNNELPITARMYICIFSVENYFSELAIIYTYVIIKLSFSMRFQFSMQQIIEQIHGIYIKCLSYFCLEG